MFGARIFYRRSRVEDIREAGEVGGFLGNLIGMSAKFVGDRMAGLFDVAATGKNLVIGNQVEPTGRIGKLVGILESERLKHTHVLGATGTGKTTTLANQVLQDIYYGHGVGLIDVQGDLTNIILSHIPEERFDDVVILDATDIEHPVGFNILEAVSSDERSRTASEVIGIIQKTLGADSWGPRMEHILRNAILTLLSVSGTTLVDLRKLLVDKPYRHDLLMKIHDPLLQEFWLEEFEPMKDSQQNSAVMPILNKIGQWLTYPELRNILGQTHSSFNMRHILDTGKIFLVRIPQGQVGEDIASFLGALVVSKIQMATMSRADMPKSQRRPFYLYVDEFQNFVTGSFKKILTEARAYGLGLTVANQYEEQLSKELMLALEKNVAIRLTAMRLEGEHLIKLEDMHELDHPAYMLKPLPPIGIGEFEQIRVLYQLSRDRYSRPRIEVENAMYRRASVQMPKVDSAQNQQQESSSPFGYDD